MLYFSHSDSEGTQTFVYLSERDCMSELHET
jgi:hypothetical protein